MKKYLRRDGSKGVTLSTAEALAVACLASGVVVAFTHGLPAMVALLIVGVVFKWCDSE